MAIVVFTYRQVIDFRLRPDRWSVAADFFEGEPGIDSIWSWMKERHVEYSRAMEGAAPNISR